MMSTGPVARAHASHDRSQVLHRWAGSGRNAASGCVAQVRPVRAFARRQSAVHGARIGWHGGDSVPRGRLRRPRQGHELLRPRTQTGL